MKGAEKLLHTIREKKVNPVPAWQFRLKNALWITAFAGSAVLGALAFSVILFSVQQTDFNVIAHLGHSPAEAFLAILPLIWVAFQVAGIGLAMFAGRHTEQGYKYPLSRLFRWNLGLSILLGTAFFITGGAQQLEHTFATRLELYEGVQEKKEKIWSSPSEGYLGGTIQAVNGDQFTLTDFEGKTWTVDHSGAFIPPMVQMVMGERVKLVGKETGSATFHADEVRPWGGPNQRLRR